MQYSPKNSRSSGLLSLGPWVNVYGIPTAKVGKRKVDVREEEMVYLHVAYLMVAI